MSDYRYCFICGAPTKFTPHRDPEDGPAELRCSAAGFEHPSLRDVAFLFLKTEVVKDYLKVVATQSEPNICDEEAAAAQVLLSGIESEEAYYDNLAKEQESMPEPVDYATSPAGWRSPEIHWEF